jgi:hypothetical protein
MALCIDCDRSASEEPSPRDRIRFFLRGPGGDFFGPKYASPHDFDRKRRPCLSRERHGRPRDVFVHPVALEVTLRSDPQPMEARMVATLTPVAAQLARRALRRSAGVSVPRRSQTRRVVLSIRADPLRMNATTSGSVQPGWSTRYLAMAPACSGWSFGWRCRPISAQIESSRARAESPRTVRMARSVRPTAAPT